MKKIRKAEQKIITFVDSEEEYDRVEKEVLSGWTIVGMYFNGKNFVGILEKTSEPANNNQIDYENLSVYIPPRKKLKFS